MVRCVQYSISDEKGKRTRPVDSAPAKEYDREKAARQAERLCREGVDCIELCGAFGEAGARAVIAATHNQVPVGFVTHLPEQEELFRTTFGG